MIFNNNQIYGKVWKVTHPENNKYIDLQMTTSEKDADGNYKNSGWFPRVIGHALNSLKEVKEGDRICITKSKFTNERYEDANGNKKSAFRFIILEASILSDNNSTAAPEQKEQTKAPKQKAQEQADDCPW